MTRRAFRFPDPRRPIRSPTLRRVRASYSNVRPRRYGHAAELLPRLVTDLYDAADLAPGPHAGTFATERKDGHGRTTAIMERYHASAVVESRETLTEYLPTNEPAVITRVRVGQATRPVVRWMRYDTLGRMVLNVEPNTTSAYPVPTTDPSAMHAWRYVYNDFGDLVGTSDARGCGVNFAYDGAGRLRVEDYSPCSADHATYVAPDLNNPSGPVGAEVLYFMTAHRRPPIPASTDLPDSPSFRKISSRVASRRSGIERARPGRASTDADAPFKTPSVSPSRAHQTTS